MTFRARLVLAGIVAAGLPVLALGLVVRHEGVERITEAAAARMDEVRARVAGAWDAAGGSLEGRLGALSEMAAEDNAVRVALGADDPAVAGRTLHQAVARFAASSALDAAYILDDDLILAASHSQGATGQRAPRIGEIARHEDGPVVAEIDFPDRRERVLCAAGPLGAATSGARGVVCRSLAGLGLQPGGPDAVLAAELAGSDGVVLTDAVVGTTLSAADFTGRGEVGEVAWQDESGIVPAPLAVVWRDPALAQMVRAFDRALMAALAGAALLALLLGRMTAGQLSEPVERLADAARAVHLGRLDVSFVQRGGRELERLGRFLNGMLDRIRDGVAQVREAEKRATLGEMARQVNHDIRNGLVPIRSVVGHLAEARRAGPDELAEIFDERSGTITASVDYLGELADQYRSVAAHGSPGPADLHAIARSVAAASEVEAELADDGPAWVEMDPVSLRRVIENLVANAVAAASEGREEPRDAGGRRRGPTTRVAAAGGGAGTASAPTGKPSVHVSVHRLDDDGPPRHRLVVADNGPGIPAELRERVFEPFFSTRSEGSGLGLAITRTLVRDVGGDIRLVRGEGPGATIEVILNEAPPGATAATASRRPPR